MSLTPADSCRNGVRQLDLHEEGDHFIQLLQTKNSIVLFPYSGEAPEYCWYEFALADVEIARWLLEDAIRAGNDRWVTVIDATLQYPSADDRTTGRIPHKRCSPEPLSFVPVSPV